MSISSFQTQHEIAMRWQAVLEAAGMFDAAYKPANIYRLACVIMDDLIVAKRRLAKIVANPDAETVTVAVLNEMSAAERAALKERIIAAHSQPLNSHHP